MSIRYPVPRKLDDVKRFVLQPSLTHLFSCEFPVPVGLLEWADPKNNYTDLKLEYNNRELYDKVTIMCSEASLPGASLMTHEINNDYTGTTERHAYRRSYDDRADFTFYVDENYDIIKFFHLWIGYISNDKLTVRAAAATNNIKNGMDMPTYNNRVRFPDQYKTQRMSIRKFEKNAELDSNPDNYIYNSDPQKEYLTYNFVNAFPTSINSMPVSYDQPSLLKCTVSFTYSRYWMEMQNPSILILDR
jgi:hypothetical protein